MARINKVTRKPRKCPYCRGNVYRILYGEPMYSEYEYFEHFGEHVIFGGCCITGDDPEWACNECGREYKRLQFPRNSKQIARDALLNFSPEIYCDVEYVGLYRNKMTFRGVVKEGIYCDGFNLVFVSQNGRTKIMTGIEIIDIIQKIKVK